MKLHNLFNQRGNTTIHGVLTTIRDIYLNNRPRTSTKLCHKSTAENINVAQPTDTIVLYGYEDMVVHSAILRNGELLSSYEGVSSTKLLSNGNLQITWPNGEQDNLEPVYTISVGDFLDSIGDNNE